ncbi:Uncharacterised protein [Vibrio cholerae]|nr:Uncharacterised protein [Vibrio cholerae]
MCRFLPNLRVGRIVTQCFDIIGNFIQCFGL